MSTSRHPAWVSPYPLQPLPTGMIKYQPDQDCFEIDGRTKRQTLLYVTDPERFLARMFERGEHERFTVTVAVTNKMAAACRACTVVNRKYRPQTARKYLRKMIEGHWRLTHQGAAFSYTGNLMDCQHRLGAAEGLPNDKWIPLTLTFGCEPDEFEVYDRGMSRTATHDGEIDNMPYASALAAMAGMYLRMAGEPDDSEEVTRKRREMYQEAEERREEFGLTDEQDNILIKAAFIGDKLGGLGKSSRAARAAEPKIFLTPKAATVAYWHIVTNSSEEIDVIDRFFEEASKISTHKLIMALHNVLAFKGNWTSVSGQDARSHDVKKAGTIINYFNRYVSRIKQERETAPRNPLIWESNNKLPEVR